MQNYRRGYPVRMTVEKHPEVSGLRSDNLPEMVILFLSFFSFCQNLTDEECSEDKMNNLQFYLNKFPSAPDGEFLQPQHLSDVWMTGAAFYKFPFFSLSLLSSSLGTDIYIESFLKEWKTDYKRLERVHSYIQWYVQLLAVSSSLLHRSCNNSYK